MKKVSNRKNLWNKVWLVAGSVMLAAAVVGVFLPLFPQIPFAILAAFCFSKGSPKMHKWIRGNRFFGKPVRDWEDHQVVQVKTKIFSIVFMLGGAAIGHWQLEDPWPYVVDGVFLACILFVLSRKSRPHGPRGLAYK